MEMSPEINEAIAYLVGASSRYGQDKTPETHQHVLKAKAELEQKIREYVAYVLRIQVK
jgi:hypothetical protein